MKESNFKEFKGNDVQEFIKEGKKLGLEKYFSDQSDSKERFSGNTLGGILEFLELKDRLNFINVNKFIKNSLYEKNTTENTKEFVFREVYLPLIKNGIKKIMSSEKYANILFGEIIEPFVSDFYNQNFSNLDYGNLMPEERTSVLRFLYFHRAPHITMDRIKEMLRYVVFVKLIEVIHSDTADELIKSIYGNIDKNQTQVDLYKNIIINYLNSSSVVDDIKRFLDGPNYRDTNRWMYMFACNLYNLLGQKFPKETTNEDKEKKIACKLCKFTTSRLIHLEKPSEEYCKQAVYYLITYFCLAYGGRFLTNPKDFASYLNETGDLEQLLFNPKADFIRLFDLLPRDSYDYSKGYRKYLKTERDKAYFDKMLLLADRRKSKCEKATTFMKYYTCGKWFACAKDAFNGLCGSCTRTKDFLKTNFDTCCNKHRPKLNLDLNISLDQNENIPLLDNNNQENNHEHQE